MVAPLLVDVPLVHLRAKSCSATARVPVAGLCVSVVVFFFFWAAVSAATASAKPLAFSEPCFSTRGPFGHRPLSGQHPDRGRKCEMSSSSLSLPKKRIIAFVVLSATITAIVLASGGIFKLHGKSTIAKARSDAVYDRSLPFPAPNTIRITLPIQLPEVYEAYWTPALEFQRDVMRSKSREHQYAFEQTMKYAADGPASGTFDGSPFGLADNEIWDPKCAALALRHAWSYYPDSPIRVLMHLDMSQILPMSQGVVRDIVNRVDIPDEKTNWSMAHAWWSQHLNRAFVHYVEEVTSQVGTVEFAAHRSSAIAFLAFLNADGVPEMALKIVQQWKSMWTAQGDDLHALDKWLENEYRRWAPGIQHLLMKETPKTTKVYGDITGV
eukprot:GHVT01004921.1.p1 GENE.GHVT01004921.1~~GHVT01004921.1.p1  ORF type:complete len:382 (-),score=75.50 GHVT01004921.1:1796-2941(-)